jgi:hypothetical protein
MSNTKNPKPAKNNPPPAQDPSLGDLTPEFILWHEENHSEEEHRTRYANRIPFHYPETHNISLI